MNDLRQIIRQSQTLTFPAIAVCLCLMGCHIHEPLESCRIPAVNTRFTANPLSSYCNETTVSLRPQSTPNIRVGLTMQSSPEPIHTQFASRLGTILIRELQLSAGSFGVQPLDSLPMSTPNTTTPANEFHVPSDVTTVAFEDSQNSLPPALPPSPLFLTPTPPLVDQILVVRVIEYRPYFPMLATLELRVLDGESRDSLFTTTVTWSGEDYQLCDCSHKASWRHRLFCHNPSCDPAPGHNSPQALMHEIAGDVTAWYTLALAPPAPPVQHSRFSVKRWR
jgi:hypothetical protein